MRGEREQSIMNDSVTVDTETGVTTAKLPFMHDPLVKLAPNKHQALKVYKQQLKRLNKNPDYKRAIIEAEKKLHDMGFMAYVKDLPDAIKNFLRETPIRNFLPWRISKKDSVSIPV